MGLKELDLETGEKKGELKTGQPETGQPETGESETAKRNVAKWKVAKRTVAVVSFCIVAFTNGFDVSSVANIQPRLYEVFGHIELLPWIGLSYSLANFATLPIARGILMSLDMKYSALFGMAVFAAGAATAGSAQTIAILILGRAMMGVGGSICQHCAFSYCTSFAEGKASVLYSILSVSWALGLVAGGLIGSVFATSVTWRWACYINLPLLGFASVLAIFCLPKCSMSSPRRSLSTWVIELDLLGTFLQIAATVLFAVSFTLSGPVWPWGSASSTGFIVAFACTTTCWFLQQCFSFLTTPEHRVFPFHCLFPSEKYILPLWLASACAGATYAITLYYLPLFFAFTQGVDGLQQMLRVLPFTLSFIFVVLVVGAVVKGEVSYWYAYVAGGTITFAAGTTLALTLEVDMAQYQVMVLSAFIGIGLGMHFQHGSPIASSRYLGNPKRKADLVILFNYALMGGISFALVIAGAIYENHGFDRLASALQPYGHTDQDIREALAGVSSAVWQTGGAQARERGLQVLCGVISDLAYLIVSSSFICLLCGLAMTWQSQPRFYRGHMV